jgi:ribosomal protein S26
MPGHVICENCGKEVPEEESVSGQGSVKEDGAEKLAEGETIPASELFAFDEKYCSFDCLMAGDDSE